VTLNLGFIVESLVAVLLMVTIGYCLVLNRRLRRFKADEQSLRATISELIAASEIAERAIERLKVTVHECDDQLCRQLGDAERLSEELRAHVNDGSEVLDRLSRIVAATRPAKSAAPDPNATLAAANAFAERARTRSTGVAA
jgi:hypothetical protein